MTDRYTQMINDYYEARAEGATPEQADEIAKRENEMTHLQDIETRVKLALYDLERLQDEIARHTAELKKIVDAIDSGLRA